MKYEVTVEDHTYTIEVGQEGMITVDGEEVEIDFATIGLNGQYSLLVNHESFEALVEERDGHWQVLLMGHLYELDVLDERAKRLAARTSDAIDDSVEVKITAPMPGLVVAIPVEVGQEVEAGDNIIILESMKMENELRTPRAGRVDRINVAQGDSVDQHQVMVVIV